MYGNAVFTIVTCYYLMKRVSPILQLSQEDSNQTPSNVRVTAYMFRCSKTSTRLPAWIPGGTSEHIRNCMSSDSLYTLVYMNLGIHIVVHCLVVN